MGETKLEGKVSWQQEKKKKEDMEQQKKTQEDYIEEHKQYVEGQSSGREQQ